MPIKLKDNFWSHFQAERVKGVLAMNLKRSQAIPDARTRRLLADYGLPYSQEEWGLIKAVLLADDTLEETP